MSRTMSLLKMAQVNRMNGQAISLESEKQSSATRKNLLTSQTSQTNSAWIIGIIIMFLVLSNITLTFRLFTIMRDYTSETNTMMSELDKLEKVLVYNTEKVSDFSDQMKKISTDLASTDNKIQDSTAKIAQLEKTNEIQKVAIQNLVKAKGTLFDRVYKLELELNKFNQPAAKEM